MKRQQLKFLHSLAVLLMFVIPAWAESDLSGTWKLNLSETDFGYLGDSGTLLGPDEAIMMIDQDGSVIKVGLFQAGGSGEIKSDLIYYTDGTECRNELEGYALTSSLYWKGDDLMVKSHLAMDPFYPDFEDLWVLSEDGNKLTINRRLRSVAGDDSQRWVFDKQQ